MLDLFILLFIFIFINVLWLYSFLAIDWMCKEANEKVYKLGKLRYLMVHCCRATNREWPPSKKPRPVVKDPYNSKTVSALAFWLQIANLMYLLTFVVALIFDKLYATNITWFFVKYLLVIYGTLWISSSVYCAVRGSLLEHKAKKKYEEQRKKDQENNTNN